MTQNKLLVATFLALVFIVGCTKQQPKSEKVEAPITITEDLPHPSPASGFSPVELAAQKKCNDVWAAAAEAYRKFEEKSNATTFKALTDSIPKPLIPFSRCDNQNVILQALDYKMGELLKNSGDVFNFTVFLAKVQHIGDGAISEGICEQGPNLLKKDTTNFLRALKQERSSFVQIDCLLASTYDFIDMPPEQIRKGLQLRIDLLKKVKSENLKEIRDELIGVIIGRINQL
ncbi:MAG: hypothetical protein H6625_11575 [Bdellovibrionaceae bacterium]|nr:hypothetical protein [Pseudobdellovibrionaceae bacterium]